MSNLSAFPYIAERSEGTPGLWNYPLSIISANIAALDSGLTSSSPSGNTFSFLTNIETSGGAHFQYISVGSTPPSYVTTAAITVEVNSAYSDYLYFVDSSAQKSSYVIGSRAGGLSDGLGIWDASAGTMIVAFSKQSVRFFQQVVGPVFDLGGALTGTYNAATFGTASQSTESRIQAAINQASIDAVARVYIPSSMYPYSASSMSFIYTVQMVREGGEVTVYDVRAYGASGNGVRDDSTAINSTISAANAAGGGTVFVPLGTYLTTTGLRLQSNVVMVGVESVVKTSIRTVVILTGSGVTSAAVRDISFFHTGPDQTDDPTDQGVAVWLSNCVNVAIRGCLFTKTDDAIYTSDCDAIIISDSRFTQFAGAGWRARNTRHSIFAGNTLDGDRTGIGNAVSGVNGVWISSNDGAIAQSSDYNVINGNTFYRLGYEGVNITAGQHNAVVANVFDTCLTGVNLSAGGAETVQPVRTAYNTVTGNVIRNAGLGGGVRIGNAGSNNVAPHHNAVVGNAIHTTTGDGIGLAKDASDNLVEGNLIYDVSVSGNGIGFPSSTSMCNRNLIIGNSIDSSANHGILLYQAGTGNAIRQNRINSCRADGIRLEGTTLVDCHVDGNLISDCDKTDSNLWAGIQIVGGTRALVTDNKIFCSDSAHFQQYGILTTATPTSTIIVHNDCRNNRVGTTSVADTSALVIDPGTAWSVTQGAVIVGTTPVAASIGFGASTDKGQFGGPVDVLTNLNVLRYANPGAIRGYRANGSAGAATKLLANNAIASLVQGGYDGTAGADAGYLRAISINDWSASDHGIYWRLSGCGSGSVSISDILDMQYGLGLKVLNGAGTVISDQFRGQVNSATTATYSFTSETSLGLYRSGVSTIGLSYGALAHPDGSNTTPSIGFSSNTSLGFYSSGVQTIATSLGTFNLATNSVRLSMRTLAASGVTASAAKTNVATNEVVFTIGGASGASLIISSGGTAYIFNSASSAILA